MNIKRKYWLILFFALIHQNLYSQVLLDWQKWYTSAGNYSDYGNAITADDSGYVYTSGTATRPGGYNIGVLIKYKPNSDSVWVRQFSFPNRGASFGTMYIDSEKNIYVAGYPTILKYNSSGTLLWYRADSANNWGISGGWVNSDAEGYLYTAGYSAYSDSSGESVAIGKYEPINGGLVWRKFHSSPRGVWINDMVMDKNDNIIICGYMPFPPSVDFLTFKYDKNGNFKWSRLYSGPDLTGNPHDEAQAVTVDDTGNVYVTGRSDTTSGQTTYLTIKYDTAGTAKWMRRFEIGGSGSGATDISVDKQGNVYVTGQTGTNRTTIKYSNDGTLLWQRTLPGSSIFPIYPKIHIDSAANVYIATVTGSSGNSTYIAAKYNTNGDTLWTYTKPPPWSNNEVTREMFVDKKGNVYITGEAQGTSIGGGINIFTVKLSQPISGITNISNEVPGSFSLSQNYPNPFNPTTKIRFSVPSNVRGQTSNVKLQVFDLLGREASLLVNEALNPGTYEYDFDASHLSSGIYYYRLTSDNFSDTKKLVVLK